MRSLIEKQYYNGSVDNTNNNNSNNGWSFTKWLYKIKNNMKKIIGIIVVVCLLSSCGTVRLGDYSAYKASKSKVCYR